MPVTPDEQLTVTLDEQLTPVVKLAKKLKVHVSTVYRWGAPKGVRGHQLKLLSVGGRTYVRNADWQAFLQALNKHTVRESQDQTRMRRQGDHVTDTELDAAGL